MKISQNRAYKDQVEAPLISLIVAFYNAPRLLEFLLASLDKQSLKRFEVLLCDDGSSVETLEVVRPFLEQASFPILHLWHEDIGFRKNRMLNWGIHNSKSEKIVFIDQDCLLHPEFLAEHSKYLDDSRVLCGRRMDLTPWVSKMLTADKIRNNFIEKNLWWIIPSGLYMKDNNGKKGIYLKESSYRNNQNKKYRGIVGCNFSVTKNNLLKVNGFDTRYEGPGVGEDSDIEYRLNLLGVKMQSFAHAAVQYHVYHKLQKRNNRNEEIFVEVRRQQQMITPFGLQQQVYENPTSTLTQ